MMHKIKLESRCRRLVRGATTAAVAAMLGAGLVACNSSGSDDPQSSAELTELSVGLPVNSLGMYGYFAAESLGYFEDEGLDVTLTTTGGGAEALQQLVAGNFDIAEVAPDAALGALGQVDLYPFFTYFTKSFRDIGFPENGEITSVEQLRGQTIGVSSFSGGEIPLLHYVLREAGLGANDVSIVEIGEEPASVIAAIDGGRIQAIAHQVSTFVSLEAQGYRFDSVMPAHLAEGPIEGLVARSPWNEEPETLAALGRAVARGLLFCRTNSDACLDVIGERRPELIEDRELAETTITRFLGLTEPPQENGRFRFSPLSRDTWQAFLEIFSEGDEPLIEDASAIDLDAAIIDLSDEINDFDYDAVIGEAEAHN